MCSAKSLEEYCEILWGTENELANTAEADKGKPSFSVPVRISENGLVPHHKHPPTEIRNGGMGLMYSVKS